MDLETLKQKWGPLPVWGWGVLGGLAVLIGVYFYNRERSLKSNDGTVSQDVYSGADAALGSGAVSNSVIPTDIETNQTWLIKSVNYLSDQGVNSADAMVWLQSLLSGIPIVGSDAKKAVQDAIDRFGTPPDLSYGVPTFVEEATTPPTTAKYTKPTYFGPDKDGWYRLYDTAGKRMVSTRNKAIISSWSLSGYINGGKTEPAGS
jgi:hypothetical protein